MTTAVNKHYIVALSPELGLTGEPKHVTARTTQAAVEAALDEWIYQDYEFAIEDLDGYEAEIWVAEAKSFTIHRVSTSARWTIDEGKKAT